MPNHPIITVLMPNQPQLDQTKKQKCTRTFHHEVSSTDGLSSRVLSTHTELARVLVEDLGNVERVEVSLLLDLKVTGADQAAAITVPGHSGGWMATDLYGQFDCLAFTAVLRLHLLGEGWWCHGSCENGRNG